jgi:hydroxypyruvate isomerase
MMFNEEPFLDRMDMAAGAGFQAVECLFPYEHPAAVVASRLRAAGLQQVLFNAPPGNWERGDRGTAALPERREEFRNSLNLALEYAEALSCQRLHVMAGIPDPAADLKRCEENYIENLVWAAQQAAPRGIAILIEPLNPFDVPGYFLGSVSQAIDIIGRAVSGNIRLQFDAYHVQMTQGRIVDTFRKNLASVGHIQVSGVPGRCEPDAAQEINYEYFFSVVDESGYDGWIGCEYRPRNGTENGLSWFTPWRIDKAAAS